MSQLGKDVTGALTIQMPTDALPLLGTVTGSMSGSTFSFEWVIPGGCSPFGPNCDLQASGSASVRGTSMSGSYRCSSNCTDLVSNGRVSLTKSATK